MKLAVFLAGLFIFCLTAGLSGVSAQGPAGDRFEASVSRVIDEGEIEFDSRKQKYQKLEITALTGSREGQLFTVDVGNIPEVNVRTYQTGDKVVVTVSKDFEGNEVFYITDYVRRTPLYWLFGIFAVLTLVIGRIRGATSLLGMGFSFLIIFTFILPQISSGRDPVFIAIAASFLMIPVTFFLSHGISYKTLAAVVGTGISLIITGVLANIFVEAAVFTGFSSEEAGFLQSARPGEINIKGLLLAGIIIGVLGILDDVTISQSSIVSQLKKTSPQLGFKALYTKAMDIGRDHIASVVNTLILVYTGAALPLLLLFVDNPAPFSEVINYEFVAEEILRTLVSSIGLILAVPITTCISAYLVGKRRELLK